MSQAVRKIKRLRKARCTAILVIIIMAMMLMLGSFNKAAGAEDSRFLQTVVVSQGDTLWELVREHGQYEGDIRQAIYEVKRLNGLKDANIWPGQLLYIP